MKIYLSSETAELLQDWLEAERVAEPKVDALHPQEQYRNAIAELCDDSRDEKRRFTIAPKTLELILQEFDWVYPQFIQALKEQKL